MLGRRLGSRRSWRRSRRPPKVGPSLLSRPRRKERKPRPSSRPPQPPSTRPSRLRCRMRWPPLNSRRARRRWPTITITRSSGCTTRRTTCWLPDRTPAGSLTLCRATVTMRYTATCYPLNGLYCFALDWRCNVANTRRVRATLPCDRCRVPKGSDAPLPERSILLVSLLHQVCRFGAPNLLRLSGAGQALFFVPVSPFSGHRDTKRDAPVCFFSIKEDAVAGR
jgi:hypothetical protein